MVVEDKGREGKMRKKICEIEKEGIKNVERERRMRGQKRNRRKRERKRASGKGRGR